MGEAAAPSDGRSNTRMRERWSFCWRRAGEFYFIEVNTRLQVEHPVTELVTGMDLVRLQIEIAEGKRLPPHPRSIGHAIEARLNAEDPLSGFLPSAGTVRVWRRPDDVRVDTALEAGAEAGIQYDSLLAKIVSYGADRESARRKLVYALRNTVVFRRGDKSRIPDPVARKRRNSARAGLTRLFCPLPELSGDITDHVAAAILYLNRSAVKGIPPELPQQSRIAILRSSCGCITQT